MTFLTADYRGDVRKSNNKFVQLAFQSLYYYCVSIYHVLCVCLNLINIV